MHYGEISVMINKIPSSLNWFIKKHARLSGEIVRTKKRLKKVQALVDHLRKLESDRDVLEKTLALHEIQIDINLIRPVRPRKFRLPFPKGHNVNFVFEYLKTNSKERIVSKSEIVEALKIKYFEHYSPNLPHVNFTDAVAEALHRHLRAGRVVRCHNLVTSSDGLWQLAEYYNQAKLNAA